MNNTRRCVLALLLILSLALLVTAQTRVKGEISGLVTDKEDQPLPGASVTLTGASLFQKSLSIISTDQGAFRFLNLNPGEYELEIVLSGFSPLKLTRILVNFGRATPIKATLSAEAIQAEINVVAEAPLIETKTPQVTVNYTSEIIETVPTTRDMKDLINASPGINDNVAYGARGRVNNSFAEGSMSSSYKLNGLDVSGVDYAYTFITPIWETIQEVQIGGIGMSAEAGNFTGASVNVITKSGTNTIHGGASVFYTNDHLEGDNSHGLLDLRTGRKDHDFEGTVQLGGPIIKEKLFYYAAGSYIYKKFEESYGSPVLSRWKRPNYYGKIDWLLNNKNTVSAMVMGNPLSWYDLYMIPGSPSTIGADEFLKGVSWSASWQSILGAQTYLETRYGGFRNKWSRYPHTRGVPRYSDGDTGRAYGGMNYDFDMWTARHEVNATLSHYADDFLGASHELKGGIEYENGHDWKKMIRPGALSSYTIGDQVLWRTTVGGNDYSDRRLVRVGGFFQDNFKVGRKLNLNIGLRLDSPRLTAVGASGTIHSFTVLSPRIGLSYDMTGDAKNVLHFSYSRLYNRMMTGTYTQMLPGRTDQLRYMVYEDPAPFDPTNENILAKFAAVSIPENLYAISSLAAPIPYDPDFKEPYTQLFSVGFEKQLFGSFALELNYIYRSPKKLAIISTETDHTYESFQWTDPWLGKTVTLWQQTDSLADVPFVANSSWQKARTHLFMVNLRRRMVGRWALNASFVYEDTKANVQDPDGEYLFGYPSFNTDKDPYYYQNPYMWGEPWMTHKYSFKLLGTYMAPWGIAVSGNFRALSGIAWETQVDGSYADIYRSYSYITIFMEPRGSQHVEPSYLVDLRLAKIFNIGGQELELRMDLMNVFNKHYALVVYQNPDAIYSSGQPAYGKSMTSQFQGPRSLRLGLRWRF